MLHPLIASLDLDLSGPQHAYEWLLPSLPRWSPRAHVQPRSAIALDVRFGSAPSPGQVLLQLPLVEVSCVDGALLLTAPRVGATVRDGRIELRYEPSASPRCVQAVFDALWPLVLPAHGLVHVRAAALADENGDGWLLAGDTGTGKSTAMLSLASSGWRFAADDAVYVAPGEGGTIAHGWAAPVRVTARTAHLFGLERESAMNEMRASAVLDVGLAARRVDSVPARRLLFPEIAGATALRPITPAEAYQRLAADAPWIGCLPEHACRWHEALRELAALPAAALLLGPELLEEPERLAHHLTDVAAQAAA